MKQKVINFVSDVTREMKKVTWPTKEELRESTMVVVIVCLTIAAFVYVVDMIVSEALKGIL